MATVWRARDEWTREIVAVKRLHPYVVADPAARARLEREAAAMRAVDHPAIVRPRELVEDPDAPSLVMDFVEGRPLDERIARARCRRAKPSRSPASSPTRSPSHTTTGSSTVISSPATSWSTMTERCT